MAVRASWSEAREAAAAPWPACGLQPRAAPASGTVPRAARGTRAKDERCRGKPFRSARRGARGCDQRGGTRLVGRSWPDSALRRAHERVPGHAPALQPGPAACAIPDHSGRPHGPVPPGPPRRHTRGAHEHRHPAGAGGALPRRGAPTTTFEPAVRCRSTKPPRSYPYAFIPEPGGAIARATISPKADGQRDSGPNHSFRTPSTASSTLTAETGCEISHT
jgi:hypothetical protein